MGSGTKYRRVGMLMGERTNGWRVALAIITSVALASSVTAFSDANAQGSDEAISELRFATSDDYPPFNARDERGTLVGFNIDLAQAICFELEQTCAISTHSWDTLFDVLNRGEVDAVIASHRINAETLAQADFTRPYFHTPGRFVARRDGPALAISPAGLDRRQIGVAKGTAHEAFIQTFFRTSRIRRFDTPELARTALRNREIDLIFGDAISLVFWINGTSSGGCCDLAGGAYFEPLFFGDGIAIAVKKGNRERRIELDETLDTLRKNGRVLELMQRYFPRAIY